MTTINEHCKYYLLFNKFVSEVSKNEYVKGRRVEDNQINELLNEIGNFRFTFHNEEQSVYSMVYQRQLSKKTKRR